MIKTEYGDSEFIYRRNQAICKSCTEPGRFSGDVFPVSEVGLKFVRIMGITRFWDKNELLDSNTLMSDLLCGIQDENVGFVYILKGVGESIELYMGISGTYIQSLKSTLSSAFPAIEIRDVENFQNIIPEDIQSGGIVCGTPTNKMQEQKNARLQMDQLVRGLLGKDFVYVVMATALGQQDVIELHNTLLDEMSNVYEYMKETFNRNIGTSIEKQSFIHTRYFENLECMEKTYNEGISRGMWYTTTFYGTYGSNVEDGDERCIANLIRSTFSGMDSRPDMIRSNNHVELEDLRSMLRRFEIKGNFMQDFREHPLNDDVAYEYMSVINSDQLAVMTALPGKEYPGYYIDDYVEFDRANRTLDKIQRPVKIGSIRQAGRGQIKDENNEDLNPYYIEKNDYTRHCLIIGITGGGKTNTSKSLLRTLWNDPQERIPFLVIESAKREYWELRKIKGFEDLVVYTLGSDDDRTSVKYRLNPFETFPGISLQTHIDYVLSTFKAAFEMYPPMPYVLETAVYEIYEDRGWDIVTSENKYGRALYPTLDDLYDKIGYVVDNMGYHEEVASNIKSALEARIHSLMIGGKGAMLNTAKSIPIGDLLSVPTVLELEDIGDDETKSFVIGVLLTQLYEYRKANMGQKGGAKNLKHILMVEEAHRLLKNVQATGDGNSSQAKSVEFFCNMLAEIRTYGQGIFIADQVPTKLAPDTLKNTNLKIVHRTVALEDREFVGRAMNMTDEQVNYLSSLRRGYAAVYAEGDNSPKYVKLPYVQDNPELKNLTRNEVIGEIQQKVGKYHKANDLDKKHPGCTYCEMEHRCKYYAKIKEMLDPLMIQAVDAFGAYKYNPEKLMAIFRISAFKSQNLNQWEKNCLAGQILQECTDIHDGYKKKILADMLKLIAEQENK